MNLSKDKRSSDWNPFYDGRNNIFPSPLTEEEMRTLGFKRGEYLQDENGYYAWKYYSDACECGHSSCMMTKSGCKNENEGEK